MNRKWLAMGLSIMVMLFLVACGGDGSFDPCVDVAEANKNQCEGIVKDQKDGNISVSEAAARIAALSATPQGSGTTVSPQASGTTTAQPSQGAPSGTQSNGNRSVSTFLLDGRSENPRAALGMTPGGNCPLYEDTGIGLPDRYVCDIPDGWSFMAFGVSVTNNETHHGWNAGGFWVFIGPTHVDVSIVDGGTSIRRSGDEMYQEYCVRLGQHRMNGWAEGPADGSTKILPQGWDKKCGGQ